MFEPQPRPPIGDAPLSVILVAPGAGVAESLGPWNALLNGLGRPYELLVAGPKEGDGGGGYGPGLTRAVQSARHPVVAFATADAPPEDDFRRLLAALDHADLVVGCRSGGPPPVWRKLIEIAVGVFARVVLGLPPVPRACYPGRAGWPRRWVARWVFGVRLHDPESPLRLARRDAVARFPLQSQGPFVLIEMLAKANHLACLMSEEPVAWTAGLPDVEGASFRADALQVFHEPDFSPPSSVFSATDAPTPAAPEES